jgi:hypothetical protein
MNIDTIKDKFDSSKTFANVKSIVKKINELLTLTPVNIIHAHEYDARFNELIQVMISSRFVRNKSDLINKLQIVVNCISKFDAGKTSIIRPKIILLRKAELEMALAIVTDAVPWSSMLMSIDDELEHNPNRNAKIVCTFFKHGYCNNLGDILATATCAGNEHNHLDMDALTWTVRGKVIPVSAEFVADIRKLIEINDFLLIYKSTGEKYKTTLLSSIGIDTFKMQDIKNSYASRKNEPAPVLTCEAHPLYIENPDKYTPSGKIKIKAKLKTATMEVWSSSSE